MCGIAGCWQPDGLTDDATAIIRRMTDAIAHRGPDADGHWIDPEAGIALGHRRLSILDLSPAGAQPMASPSGRYVMVFNGEFYNWRDVRAEEERYGAQWRGHSDTEVFLAACDRLGVVEATRRVAGMFALGVWDRQERTLTLVRDRVGEKPLYYGWSDGTLLFGSELKAIRAHPGWRGSIDRGALTLFLRHNYVPGPYSIYENVRKLPAGTTVTFRAGGTHWPEPEPYWSLLEAAERGERNPFRGSEEEIALALEQLLSRVVGDEMVADVPLGAFLSGGIDSTLIVALMQAQSARPVKTFTMGFHEAAFNEAEHAKAVASYLGTEHTELYVTPADALAVVPQLPAMFDEPFADSSQIPTAMVAALARRHVTVALSGDGGDEGFGGYNRYVVAPRIWRWLRPVPGVARRAAARAVWSVPPDRWDRVLGLTPLPRRFGVSGDRLHKLAGLFALPDRGALYHAVNSHWRNPAEVVIDGHEPVTALTDTTTQPKVEGYVAQMMALDTVAYLPDDILVKVDRSAMAVSLECRAPLLHHEVLEFAWCIPPAMRMRGLQGKQPLRRVLHRHVPDDLIDRPKTGFGIPIDGWLRGPLRPWAEDLLDPAHLARTGLFRAEPVQAVWREHLAGRRNWQYLLWDVLMAVAWFDAQQDAG